MDMSASRAIRPTVSNSAHAADELWKSEHVDDASEAIVGSVGVLGFAMPFELESSDGYLRLMTTLTSFATATDVTIAELHLEAFLLADDATADVLRKRAQRW